MVLEHRHFVAVVVPLKRLFHGLRQHRHQEIGWQSTLLVAPRKVHGVPCSANRDQLAHGEGGSLIVLLYPKNWRTLPIHLLNRLAGLRHLVPSPTLLGQRAQDSK